MADINRRGLMLVLSSPSGAGKSTLAQLLRQVDSHIHPSVSYTTRPQRPGEVEGKSYFFVSREKFDEMIEAGELLEYAKVFDHMYGTPKKRVEALLKNGEDVIFDIDWQGNRQLTSLAREDVVSVFILPPSKKELLRRLSNRNQDSQEIIEFRMQRANAEMSHWNEYDYTVINRDLDDSLKKILAILRAERLKKARRLGVQQFVDNLLDENIEL